MAGCWYTESGWTPPQEATFAVFARGQATGTAVKPSELAGSGAMARAEAPRVMIAPRALPSRA